MITKPRISFIVLTVLLGFGATIAQAGGSQQDAKAVEVIKQMAAFKSTLSQVTISGVTLTDARLSGGLMVANTEEVTVSVNRPGQLLASTFDGEAKKGIYFNSGRLTVYNSEKKLYAQADIPEDIDAALEFALEDLGIEAPLMDMIFQDASAHLLSSDETILYLTDKARVGGADCHHLAIRGSEADVQLWVEEGDRPVVRKLMITSKWEGGSPRFTANLNWDTKPKFAPGFFEFKAPEGASKIEFIRESTEQ